MKKVLLIIAALLLLCFVVLLIGVSGDDPLSPSVEKALSFQLQPPAPEDNAYVGLAGLGLPEDGDVVAVGKKFLNGESRRDFESYWKFDNSYRNPCQPTQNQPNPDSDKKTADYANCLDQIVAEAGLINEALEKTPFSSNATGPSSGCRCSSTPPPAWPTRCQCISI